MTIRLILLKQKTTKKEPATSPKVTESSAKTTGFKVLTIAKISKTTTNTLQLPQPVTSLLEALTASFE